MIREIWKASRLLRLTSTNEDVLMNDELLHYNFDSYDISPYFLREKRLKAAVHWERPGCALAQSSPNLT